MPVCGAEVLKRAVSSCEKKAGNCGDDVQSRGGRRLDDRHRGVGENKLSRPLPLPSIFNQVAAGAIKFRIDFPLIGILVCSS